MTIRLTDPADPAVVYLAGLAQNHYADRIALSLSQIANILSRFGQAQNARFRHWHQLQPEHIEFIKTELVTHFDWSTRQFMFMALRNVLRTCRDRGLISEPRYRRLKAGL